MAGSNTEIVLLTPEPIVVHMNSAFLYYDSFEYNVFFSVVFSWIYFYPVAHAYRAHVFQPCLQSSLCLWPLFDQ